MVRGVVLMPKAREVYLRSDRAEVESVWVPDYGDRVSEQGSRELRQSIEKQFRKFAWRYSITTDEARHLLLNTGIKLPRFHGSEKVALVSSSELTH